MNQTHRFSSSLRVSCVLASIVFVVAILLQGLRLQAQDSPQGPIAPPPEHHVTRVGNEAKPEAPPSLPEAEIIKRVSQKEDEYLLARTHYTYRRTVRIQEFGPDGIRVNTISPGMVRTGMTAKVYADQRIAAERDALVPLGRVATPEDMADVVAFLLSQDARYINGHDLVVDGGVAGNFLGRLPGLQQITRS